MEFPRRGAAGYYDRMPPRIRTLIKFALLVTLVAVAFYFFGLIEIDESIAARLRDFAASTHPLATRLLYVLIYIVGALLLLPGVLLSVVGSLLFSLWEATLWTWLGATLGATVAFLVAKALGREFVDGLLGGKLKALDDRLHDHGFTGLLILRLVPLFPFNALNYGCGLTAIRARDYILATAIGILPGTFIYQYLFATLGPKVLREGFAWSDLASWDVALALLAFVAFGVVTKWLVNRARGGETRDAPDEGRPNSTG
jgi:uncharacterized membrane protein YdjX (TVP38/TMEM64 family)